ncbi:MAG: hypothetical protein KTR32_42535 [Granulosicoccus sp.]|nr:hypothetical protein [Granulosicoccus sp.]
MCTSESSRHWKRALRRKGWALFVILLTSTSTYSSPQLGRALSPAEIEALPQHIFPDGSGLPDGSGDTVAGSELYAVLCAACHGNVGQGGSALELVGDRALLTTEYPDRGIGVYWPYAPTLFEYIWRAMPPDRPYSLLPDEVYAIVARVLELNGLVDSGQRVDAEFLADLEMPNKDGFRSRFD